MTTSCKGCVHPQQDPHPGGNSSNTYRKKEEGITYISIWTHILEETAAAVVAAGLW
jgi:hypothetical protein